MTRTAVWTLTPTHSSSRQLCRIMNAILRLDLTVFLKWRKVGQISCNWGSKIWSETVNSELRHICIYIFTVLDSHFTFYPVRNVRQVICRDLYGHSVTISLVFDEFCTNKNIAYVWQRETYGKHVSSVFTVVLRCGLFRVCNSSWIELMFAHVQFTKLTARVHARKQPFAAAILGIRCCFGRATTFKTVVDRCCFLLSWPRSRQPILLTASWRMPRLVPRPTCSAR